MSDQGGIADVSAAKGGLPVMVADWHDDPAEYEAVKVIAGEIYEVHPWVEVRTDLAGASLGRVDWMDGRHVVFWPSRDRYERFYEDALDLSSKAVAKTVKIIDVRINGAGRKPTSFIASGESDWNIYVGIIKPYIITVDYEAIRVAEALAELTDYAGSPPPHGAPSTPPLDDLSAAGEPAPLPDNLPLDAYAGEFAGDSSPLRPEAAYSPYRSHETAASAPDWSASPTDFWQETKVPEMRHEWMPPALADLFSEEALTWGADPGIFGMFGIGICAGALPNYIKLQVKTGDSEWLKAARLWLVVNAYSGSMKSPILVAMARPLENLQSTLMQAVAHQQKKYLLDREIYDKQRQSYVSAKALGGAVVEPQEPEAPTRNRLIIKNATTEATHDILAEQGLRGILTILDELVSKVTGANQYKRGGSDIEEFLSMRDGGRHSIDRKGSYLQIEENGIALIGGTQPDRIRAVAKKHDMTSNGFLQRFNFYNAREATLDLDRPSHQDFGRMTDIVERLYNLQHEGPVQFSDAAKQVRLQFRQWVYDQRSPQWVNDALRSHLSKYNDFFAEFCLTFHAIQCADEHCAYIYPQVLEATAMRVSAFMRECLFPHALAFYNDVLDNSSEVVKDTRYLADKILAKGWASIDLTMIAQGWTKWRTLPGWHRKGILTTLQEGGWMQSKDPRGYIEGMSYSARVHPGLRTIFASYVEHAESRLEEMAERRRERMIGED